MDSQPFDMLWLKPKEAQELTLALQDNQSLEELEIDFAVVDRFPPLLTALTKGLLRNHALKSLRLGMNGQDLPNGIIDQLSRNLAITDLSFYRTEYPDETQKKIDGLVARNRELERVDYGLSADPKTWPEIIHLVLQNEWVGPSIVFRLLTGRPSEIENEDGKKPVARVSLMHRSCKRARHHL